MVPRSITAKLKVAGPATTLAFSMSRLPRGKAAQNTRDRKPVQTSRGVMMIAFPLLCQIMTSHRSIVKCPVHDEVPKDYPFLGLITARIGRKLLGGPGVVAPLS